MKHKFWTTKKTKNNYIFASANEANKVSKYANLISLPGEFVQ